MFKKLFLLRHVAVLIAVSMVFLSFFCAEFGNSFSVSRSGQQQFLVRFCYNSPNITTVNSQCVVCNYFSFDGLVLSCTGSTAITTNITSSQAFCIISQCIAQVPRQSPVLLGRRRRRWTKDENFNKFKAFFSRYKQSIVRNESVDVFAE